MGALTAGNAIVQTNCGLFFLHLYRLHGTGTRAFLTADAFMLIHLHPIHKGQPATQGMHKVLHRPHRTEKIAVTATAFRKETKHC